jgi:hypothetical protein
MFDREFLVVINEVECIIAAHPDTRSIILAGDMNTDFSRMHSSHTRPLREMFARLDLILCDSMFDIDFTYVNEANDARSIIDHFAVSDCLVDNVDNCFVQHDGNNLSDHHPVFLHLSLNVPHGHDAVHRGTGPKCSWNRAKQEDIQHYKHALGELLDRIPLPNEALHCSDLNCEIHTAEISQYHDALISACERAALQTIPRARKARKAGWSELVEPKQREAIFWN